jgi:hypothetical protein
MDIRGMKPAEAIAKFIGEEVFPAVEPYGFKLHKNLSMVRHVGNYKQEIYVEKSKWNMTDAVVQFDLRILTRSKTFRKWYMNFYQTNKDVNIPEGGAGGGISSSKNWNHELLKYNYGFDLMLLDHEVLARYLKENIVKGFIPDLDNISDYKKIVYIHSSGGSYGTFPYAIDICLEQKDIELAKSLIAEFDAFLPTYKGRRGEPYPQDVIDDINVRRAKIESIEEY